MLNSTQINKLKTKIQDVLSFITLNERHKKEFDFSESLSIEFKSEMELLRNFLEIPNPEQTLIDENAIRYKNIIQALATNETIRAEHGIRALHKAAATNNTGILSALIIVGVDIEKRSMNQRTALSYAAEWNCSNATETLIQAGADVNTRDDREFTPLIWATLSQNNKTIQVILDCPQVDKMARNTVCDTALRLALDGKSSIDAHQLIFQAIQLFPTPNAIKTFHITPRTRPITLEMRVAEIVTLVREIRNELTLSFIQPLPQAFLNNISIFENWLSLFLDSDRYEKWQEIQDIYQEMITLLATDKRFDCHEALTPLMFAARYYLNITVHMLIKAGANIDRVSMKHGTAFGNAASYGNVDALLTLQQHDADIDLPDGSGKTPLMAAIEPEFHEESIKLLSGFPGLDVLTKNKNGETALMLIDERIFKYEVADMLRERAVKDAADQFDPDDWSRPLWRGTPLLPSSQQLLLINEMVSFLDKLITTNSAISPTFTIRTLPAFSIHPPMKDEHSDRHQSAENQHAFDRCYGLTVCKK